MPNSPEKPEAPKPEKKKKNEAGTSKKVKVSAKLALVQDAIALMDASGLSMIHFEQAGVRIQLRRGPGADYVAPMMPAMPMAAAPSAAPVPAAAGAPAAAAAPAANEGGTKLNSPMVGTFYRSPSPDAKPFIEEGGKIEVGQVYCIIEAMKLMNEVKSEVAGKVVKILVQNGQAVEFNQPLIIVDPI